LTLTLAEQTTKLVKRAEERMFSGGMKVEEKMA
jgi:hypothetical protein